jgi:hypothetical protein
LASELLRLLGDSYFRFNIDLHKYYTFLAMIAVLLKVIGLACSFFITITNAPNTTNFKSIVYLLLGAMPLLWLIYILLKVFF